MEHFQTCVSFPGFYKSWDSCEHLLSVSKNRTCGDVLPEISHMLHSATPVTFQFTLDCPKSILREDAIQIVFLWQIQTCEAIHWHTGDIGKLVKLYTPTPTHMRPQDGKHVILEIWIYSNQTSCRNTISSLLWGKTVDVPKDWRYFEDGRTESY